MGLGPWFPFSPSFLRRPLLTISRFTVCRVAEDGPGQGLGITLSLNHAGFRASYSQSLEFQAFSVPGFQDSRFSCVEFCGRGLQRLEV